MLGKFIYGRVRRALEKKATKYYGKPYEVNELILEAFHSQDLLLITVNSKNGLPKYEEKMILSENSQQLELFLNKIKSSVNNYETGIYSKVIMAFDERVNKASVTYADKNGLKHPFNLDEKY